MTTSNNCRYYPNMSGSMETFLITALNWKGESVLFCLLYNGLPVDMPDRGNTKTKLGQLLCGSRGFVK